MPGMHSLSAKRGALRNRGAMDFYVLMDETAVYHSASDSALPALILKPRVWRCGLPWAECCGGIPTTHTITFCDSGTGYDHYLFVEYDCVVQCSLESFVARAISQDAGLVALPISRTFDQWHWTPYQRDVYPAGENKLALLNVSLFSSAALKLLHQRRLAMNVDPSVVSWPSSELFVPSEIVRAGMKWISLADFGDVSNYDWFPPTLEDDLRPGQGDTFLHPVLDRRRYIVSILQNKGSLPAGELKRALARFPREEYAKLIWPAARKAPQGGSSTKSPGGEHRWLSEVISSIAECLMECSG